MLDFGVSYYQAHQQADRVLAAQERRRKTIQLIVQQVRQSWWQAAGAQALGGKIEPLLALSRAALADSRKIEAERLAPPLETLNYQRQLLDLIRQLEAINDELSQAKPRLAALMNLEPGRPFELAAAGELVSPNISVPVDQMEETALLNRPELMEARYNERIGQLETRKALAKLLPGIEFSVGTHYDSNSFLANSSWRDLGLRVSWNLLNVFSAGSIKKTAELQSEIAHRQRLALSMVVLTQTQVAYRDYVGRKRQFELSSEQDSVEQRILVQTRNATSADAQGKLNEIRAAASALFSELRRYQSYSALQGSYGQMLATLGVDPLPEKLGRQRHPQRRPGAGRIGSAVGEAGRRAAGRRSTGEGRIVRFPGSRTMGAAALAAASGLAAAAPATDTGLTNKDGQVRAQLTARNEVVLSSELSAKLASLPLREGDAFKAGQTLASFDCSLFEAQLSKAQATLEAARQVQTVNTRLVELNSIGKLEVATAEGKLKESQAEVNYMQTTIRKCTVSAPYAGRVVKRIAAAYQFVTPGTQLLAIQDAGELEVHMIVPSRWLAGLKVGTTLQRAGRRAGQELSGAHPAPGRAHRSGQPVGRGDRRRQRHARRPAAGHERLGRVPGPKVSEGGVSPELLALLQLARRAREATGAEALGFTMVNESRQLFAYRQAAFWLGGRLGPRGGAVRPAAGGSDRALRAVAHRAVQERGAGGPRAAPDRRARPGPAGGRALGRVAAASCAVAAADAPGPAAGRAAVRIRRTVPAAPARPGLRAGLTVMPMRCMRWRRAAACWSARRRR